MDEAGYKLLLLFGLIPEELEKEITENTIGQIQSAANNLQWELARGLESILGSRVSLLNFPYVGAYPKNYRKLSIPGTSFCLPRGCHAQSIKFCNLMFYKHFSRRRHAKKAIKRWLNNQSDNGPIVILAYALTSDFVECIRFAKRMRRDVLSCVIVPDLPQYMNTSSARENLLVSWAKSYDMRFIESHLTCVDAFVVLTEQMADALSADRYLVMEGIAPDVHSEKKYGETKTKRVAYTGTMNSRYGVVDLVNDFMEIDDPDMELVLCGDGDAASYAKSAQKLDSRISYLGVLPRKEILKIQSEATLLVNPRRNDEEFTKYSFPSKLLEYLASGTPVVAYELDGAPREYGEYIAYVDPLDECGMQKTLRRYCHKTWEELEFIGKKGQRFARQEKSSVRQAVRIAEFLESLLDDRGDK